MEINWVMFENIIEVSNRSMIALLVDDMGKIVGYFLCIFRVGHMTINNDFDSYANEGTINF